MKNYDPNIWHGTHTIRVTLQQWDYVGHVTVKMGGNCKGMAVMSDIADTICDTDNPESDCDFSWSEDDDGDPWYFVNLSRPDGEKLEVEERADDLGDIIVAVEIVDYEKRED